MSCYDNLIGIKSGCSVTETSQSLYIEDIGITCSEADSYINNEFETGQQLIEAKIAFAAKVVSKSIQNHFSSVIETRNFLTSQNLGVYQDNLQTQSLVAANLGGLNITLLNASSYLDIYVNTISLQVNTTATISVLVYNLVTGLLIDTIAVDCVANEITTKIINKTYSSNRQKLDLIFVYDVSTIASYKCQLNYEGCGSCSGYRYANYYLAATPVIVPSASAKIRTSLTNQSHTYGMSINYTIQCSLESWLCNMSNFMALPILYKAAEEIMNYATMSSNRNNSDSNQDYEKNKERAAFFNTQYLEHLNASIGNIMLPKGDICFQCNERVKSKIILP
jgi:hypothetical protein